LLTTGLARYFKESLNKSNCALDLNLGATPTSGEAIKVELDAFLVDPGFILL
jgi:hypothetical protein